ncbi:MAG: flagellar motor protein MotB [Candidatus Scalinduaceae bacterium]
MSEDKNTNVIDTRANTVIGKTTSVLSKLLKKKKTDNKPPTTDMLSFASIMTILLAFFIMLSTYAGRPKDELAKEAVESFKGALKNFGLSRIIDGSSDSIMNLQLTLRNFGIKSKNEQSETFANLIDKEIEVEYERNGRQLIFPTNIDFVKGGLELSPSSKAYLNNLTTIIKDRDCEVAVFSYSDKGFVSTEDYPTSWQYSAERAAVVTSYLNKTGGIDYKRMTAVGYGKYQPLLGEESSFNAEANNRINIIVSYKEGY